MKRLLTVAAVAAASLLSGCSGMRIAYENADTFIRWRANSYVQLSGEASDELDDRIEAFLDWHRAKALPQYARIASEAGRRVDKGLSSQDLIWGYDSFVAQTREGLRAAAEQLAPMLDRLSPEQLAQLEQKFAEDNRKFARENLRGSEQERRKRRVKRTVERMGDWVGTLTKSQLERVRQYAERAPLLDEMRDRDRKRLQAELLVILRARAAQKRLPDAAVNWERGRDPAYVAAVESARKEYFALMLDIDRSLSPEQRKKAVARWRGLAEDFTALAEHRPQ